MLSSAIAVAILFSQAASDATAKPRKDAAANPLDRVVCRSETHIASMIPKRKCRTVREWNAIAESTSKETRRQLETEGMSGGTNTGG